MKRKKKERVARNNSVPENVTCNSPPTPSDLHLLVPGMIALFSGAKSQDEVIAITDKCRRFGNDLYHRENSHRETFRRFPHASYEAKKKCSSR